ncbi:3-isopropylmalate dehydratase small subunit (plasmid) [Buchnera aphidicola (Hyadaphis tataricae)]|uniref:3-isopropylmalate dehydratase small subunit n=1 Tax=Buchnera aphidicola (Hyadaphis tataricae) TaxID=1241859 RepID=A0A4D6Y037_9GAMM|nr:3-isopropylmalate dehydratase small subunit [Buchnera aphidicola]QCI21899.1 3-isopropylmalate dehydratase small subunit [Buchnera aphidicola (Hyadaphis tataricae)]
MFKFIEHHGVVLPLNFSNIDTDLIIPKQFLKKINKIGLGKYLFHDWRYKDLNQSVLNDKFILNKTIYQKSSILLTRENFGCGSSREHAVWSLLDYGFRVIIASSFSDIFYNNSFNNKLLLITLGKTVIESLFDIVNKDIGVSFNINLLNRKILVNDITFSFLIDDFRRFCLLNDLDHIDLTTTHMKDIDIYEKKIPDFLLKRKEFESNI